MPILPPEPYVFPETLLTDGTTSLSNGSDRWWVLHTRPRAEKALARQLRHDATGFFLPVVEHEWRSNGRMLRSYRPLFPGYLFLWGGDDARLAAIKTNAVANILPVADQQRFQSDLLRVYGLMESGAPLALEEILEPGTMVEIVEGPLAGVEGKVVRRGRRFHFIVEVRLLQQGVSMEIESWMFRPLTTTTLAAVGGKNKA
jgi:transcription antitermination factor NusG